MARTSAHGLPVSPGEPEPQNSWSTSCPACGDAIDLGRPTLGMYEQVLCPICGAVLEVARKDPLRLEEVELG